MSDDDRAGRLPPPAFPPGSRKHVYHNSAQPSKDGLGEGFISPDDPLPDRDESIDDAFISPDDPLPPRSRRAEHAFLHADDSIHDIASRANDDAFISPDEPIPPRATLVREFPAFDTDADVVVTGMGDDPHLDPDELIAGGDPYVLELMHKVGKLAQALKKRGGGGLRISPEMDRFDATLRGYCVGYLAGRRAEDPPAPEEY